MAKKSAEGLRWVQRFRNFTQAYEQFQKAIKLSNERSLNDLEKQGLIQTFEFTHDLAWNVLKDYFDFQGNPQINGSRDATREAFNKGILQEGETWMEMIKSRNKTSHTYNRATADEIVKKICEDYARAFKEFNQSIEKLISKL